MAYVWQSVDTNFPTFEEYERPREMIAKLTNYMHTLVGEIKYILANLDTTNFNRTALSEYTEETQRPAAEGIERLGKELGAAVNRLSTAEQKLREDDTAITNLQNAVDALDAATELLENAVESLQGNMSTAESNIRTLQETAGKLGAYVIPDITEGAVTLGGAGIRVYLQGEVYVNGTPIE